MNFTTLADDIAAVAHRCWCKRMTQEGWQPGAAVDRQGRIHDAIRPFNDLSEFDKEVIREQAECDEVERLLADAAAAALMPRELVAADIHIGMPVRVAGAAKQEIGKIVGWEPAAVVGRLAAIKVQWPDGAILDYRPSDRLIIPARPNA